MSARKSWDISPKRQGASPAPSPRATRQVEMVRRPAQRAAAPARAARAAPRPLRKESTRPSALRTKRKKERKKTWLAFAVLFSVVLGIAVYILWLPALRIQTVEAEGSDPAGISAVAKEALLGNALGVLPRNSIFLIPEKDIRARVLEAYPAVQAVSISATGLTTLKVTALARSNAFVWCGESPLLPADSCYEADAEGLVFAPYLAVASSTASTTPATDGGDLLVYGALEGEGESPVRKHVAYASALPGALKFIKAMRGLDADIGSVTLRNDEIDLHTKAGTRITYVIGKEGEAAILAATSFPTLDLNDGSIDYIDLRFQNKVYLKRRGE